MLQFGRQPARDLAAKTLNVTLAAVVLCFQLMLAMHPYSHSLSQQEAACQACLLGNHSTPPAPSMTPPRLPVREMHEPRLPVHRPVMASQGAAHRPRAPPALILPA